MAGFSKLDGLVKRKLIRELALGALKQTQLADKYDVTPAAITLFKQRNADEINAIRADMDNEYAGLLIVQKAYRLGTLQTLLEMALTPQPKVSASGRVAYVTDPATGEERMVEEIALDSATRILKQVAEEMGQLPTRVQLSGELTEHVTYKIEGPDDV